MKTRMQSMVIALIASLAVPCLAQPVDRRGDPVPGVGFVLKIEAEGMFAGGDTGELLPLITAFGSKEDSLEYRIHVNHVETDQNATIFGLYVEELAGQDSSGFAKALVEYVSETMDMFYDQARYKINLRIKKLNAQKQGLEQKLTELRGQAQPNVRKSDLLQDQLDTIIDCREFATDMPFNEAIELLRVSVDPKLNIVVLWKALFEDAEIEPSTPIDMDSIENVPLKTALDMLLKSMGGIFANLVYKVQDSVIVIGTEATLDVTESDPFLDLASAEYTDPQAIYQRRRELKRNIERLDMDIARQQASTSAIRQEIARIEGKINHAVTSDPVLKDFQSLIEMMQKMLDNTNMNSLEVYTKTLERMVTLRMNVAEHKAKLISQSGGQELATINQEVIFSGAKLASDTAELQSLLHQLDDVEKELSLSIKLKPAVQEIHITENALAEITEQLRMVEQQLELLEKPTVTCLGLE